MLSRIILKRVGKFENYHSGKVLHLRRRLGNKNNLSHSRQHREVENGVPIDFSTILYMGAEKIVAYRVAVELFRGVLWVG